MEKEKEKEKENTLLNKNIENIGNIGNCQDDSLNLKKNIKLNLNLNLRKQSIECKENNLINNIFNININKNYDKYDKNDKFKSQNSFEYEEKNHFDLNNNYNRKIIYEFLFEKIKNKQKNSKRYRRYINEKNSSLENNEIIEVIFFTYF